MESTSFTLRVREEPKQRPQQKRKPKKQAVWPDILTRVFLAGVLVYLGIVIAQSMSVHMTGAGNVALAAAALVIAGWKLHDLGADN